MKKISTLSVAIDFTKTFDSVNHDILIDKLMIYGIRDIPLKWFKTYLAIRKPYVCIGYSSSKIFTSNISVININKYIWRRVFLLVGMSLCSVF